MELPLENLFQKGCITGLDIGSSSIKLTQFFRKETAFVLTRVDMQAIPGTADDVGNREKKLATLRHLLEGVDIRKSKFVVAYNHPTAAVRASTVPPMPPHELREAIRIDSKNYFPFPIEDCLMDFEMGGAVVEQGIRKHRVSVAVCPKNYIEEILSLLNDANVRPDVLMPVPVCLQKWAAHRGSGEEKMTCVLDLGERYSEFVILKGPALIFSRKIPIAGRDFTSAMTDVLVSDRGKTALSLEGAEAIKVKVGIPPAGESRMIDEKISSVQMLSMLRAPLETLASEIDRCFYFYREETEGAKVDLLLLSGRGAALKGLPKALSEELGIDVQVGNFSEGLAIDRQGIQDPGDLSGYAVALGAALSFGKGMNLLPQNLKNERKRIIKRAGIQAAASALVLFLAFILIGMGIQVANYKKRIDVARFELAGLDYAIQESTKEKLVASILAREPYWEDVFKELSQVTPLNTYLTSLGLKDGRIILKGVIDSPEKERTLSYYIASLEKGIFKNVNLVTSKRKEDVAGSEFELECWVD